MKSLIKNVSRSPLKTTLTILVLILVCYIWMINAPFVFNDDRNIVDNPNVTTLDVRRIYAPVSSLEEKMTMPFYRPNLQFIHAMLWSVFGPDSTPFHLFSIILHFINALLLYVLIKKLRFDDFIAFIAAVLFAVHPALSQAVSYISAMAEPLGAAFLLAGLIFFIEALSADRGFRTVYAVVLMLLFFLSSMLSKESMIMALPLCLVLTLYFRFKHQRFIDRRVVLINAAVVLLVVAYIFIKKDMFTFSSLLTAGGDEKVYAQNVWIRLAAFINVFWHYIVLIFMPATLSFSKSTTAWIFLLRFEALVAFGVILLFLISTLFIKRRPLWFLGLGWFFAAMLPYSGLFRINALMREHWLYVGMMGILLLISVLLYNLINSKSRLGMSIFLVLILLCSGRTIARTLQWSDIENLYLGELGHRSSSFRIYDKLATWFKARKEWDKAEYYYQKAIQVQDRFPQPHYHLADIYIKQEKLDKAIEQLYLALKIDPAFQFGLSKLFGIYSKLGRTDKADAVLDLMKKNRAGEEISIGKIEKIIFSP